MNLHITYEKYKENLECMKILESAFSNISFGRIASGELKPTCHALITDIRNPITKDFIKKNQSIKAVGTLSTGVDHIDTCCLSNNNIELIVPEGVNAVSVAEHALMMILTLLKNMECYDDSLLKSNSNLRYILKPRILTGKKVGILGAGATARQLVKFLIAFDTRINIWTRNYLNHEAFIKSNNLIFANPEKIFKESDIISLHLPLTEDTAKIITKEMLMNVPPKCIIINTARSNLIDHSVLKEILSLRKDIKITIDEYAANSAEFDLLSNKPLFTPHIAGNAVEAVEAMLFYVADRIAKSRSI